MSEKVYWRDAYDAAEKRISELEKDIDRVKQGIMSSDQCFAKEIAELREFTETLDGAQAQIRMEQKEVDKEIHKYAGEIRNIKQDIHELKIYLKSIESDWAILYNELKELVESLIDSHHNFTTVRLNRTDKVLRELRRDMPNLLEWIINNFQHVPDFNKKAGHKWQQHFLKEKLDSDSTDSKSPTDSKHPEPKLYSDMTPEEKMLEVQKIPTEPRENDDEALFHFELKAFNDKIQELISEFVEDLNLWLKSPYRLIEKSELINMIEKWEDKLK